MSALLELRAIAWSPTSDAWATACPAPRPSAIPLPATHVAAELEPEPAQLLLPKIHRASPPPPPPPTSKPYRKIPSHPLPSPPSPRPATWRLLLPPQPRYRPSLPRPQLHPSPSVPPRSPVFVENATPVPRPSSLAKAPANDVITASVRNVPWKHLSSATAPCHPRPPPILPSSPLHWPLLPPQYPFPSRPSLVRPRAYLTTQKTPLSSFAVPPTDRSTAQATLAPLPPPLLANAHTRNLASASITSVTSVPRTLAMPISAATSASTPAATIVPAPRRAGGP